VEVMMVLMMDVTRDVMEVVKVVVMMVATKDVIQYNLSSVVLQLTQMVAKNRYIIDIST
jgi:hypothetical protein